MHRIGAVPARKGVPLRLAVDGAASAALRGGLVTEGRSGEHGEEHAGGTGVVDEAAGSLPGPDVSVRFGRRSDTWSHRWVAGSGTQLGGQGAVQRFERKYATEGRRTKLWIVSGA